MIITRKIEIYFDGDKKKEDWQYLRDLSYKVYKMANLIVAQQFVNDSFLDLSLNVKKEYRQRLVGGEKIGKVRKDAEKLLKEYYGMSIQNTSYRQVAAMPQFADVPSYVYACLNKAVVGHYKSDRKEMMRGDRSIRTYRRGMPVPFMKSKMVFYKEGEQIKFSWFNKSTIVLRFGRDRSNNREIVEQIIRGEYKASDSSIQCKDGKAFLLLCVGIPNERPALDPELCVGVDLGLTVPACCGLSKGADRKFIGSNDGLLYPRIKMQKQREALQRSLALNKGGKGRKKKLAKLENLKKRERNFVQTVSHKISKQVIDFALKHGAGTIKLENLKGIARDEKSKWILRNWSYYELQKFIEYKAKRAGIKVIYIDPAYTSQTCHKCDHKEKEQRKSQAKFVCNSEQCDNYEVPVNADYNASINIARAVPRPRAEAKSTRQAASES